MSDPKLKTDAAFERLFAEASSTFSPPPGLKDAVRRRMKTSPRWRVRPALWMGTAAAVLLTVVAVAWHPWTVKPAEPIQVTVPDGPSFSMTTNTTPGDIVPSGGSLSVVPTGPSGSGRAPFGIVQPEIMHPSYAGRVPAGENPPVVSGGVVAPGPSSIARPTAGDSGDIVPGPAGFSEGLAPRRGPDERVGFIGADGRWVIPPHFVTNLTLFHDGLALVVAGDPPNQEILFIDRQGKPVPIPDTDARGNRFVYRSGFSDDLAVIEQDGKFGYVNRKGKVVIKPQFTFARPFSEGMAVVMFPAVGDNAETGAIIDTTGKVLATLKEASTAMHVEDLDFHEGLRVLGMEAKKDTWKWGFVGRDGKTVIEPKFDSATRFGDGLAAVQVGNKWGYIDRTGRVVIAPQFTEATAFSEKVARVRLAGPEVRYAFIDTTGKVVIPYEKCGTGGSPFSGGMAYVAFPGLPVHWGYIDHTGKLVIEFQP